MTRASSFHTLLTTTLCILIVDRISKWIVVEFLDLPGIGRIEIMPPFLNFVMAWNRGINFGIGAGGPDFMRWLLIVLALVISVALSAWAIRRGAPAILVGAGAVVGGALGNAWDRAQYGAVADFLNMSCCGIENPYAFNIADCAIFLGAVAIAIKA